MALVVIYAGIRPHYHPDVSLIVYRNLALQVYMRLQLVLTEIAISP